MKTTTRDAVALRKIAHYGFVGVDADGEPFLEGKFQIGRGRFKRLIEQGLLEDNEDGLPLGYAGQIAQTYSVSAKGKEVLSA